MPATPIISAQVRTAAGGTIGSPAEFYATLLHSAVSAHVLHLSTRSLAQHLALDELYKALPEAVDALIEAWQGRNGLVTAWPDGWTAPTQAPADFVSSLRDYVDLNRGCVGPEGELQQLVDDVLELLDKASYKLEHLS